MLLIKYSFDVAKKRSINTYINEMYLQLRWPVILHTFFRVEINTLFSY